MTPAPNSAVLEATETTESAQAPITSEAIAAESAVLEDLLVEEISIDGMCGVY
ncbi:MAG: mycofactocin precursor [Ilumatobacteraceae bacterium]|nr:mycofactocin precursor [Ilumatobacteraceae bacterium]